MTQFKTKVPEWRCFVVWNANWLKCMMILKAVQLLHYSLYKLTKPSPLPYDIGYGLREQPGPQLDGVGVAKGEVILDVQWP